MIISPAVLFMGGLVFVMADKSHAGPQPAQEATDVAAPARPGDLAVQEELAQARKTGTVAAYELFLARHANHPLAPVARAERDRLAR
jgi:hypothetical protein